MAIEIEQDSEKVVTTLTNWENEPTVADLKADFLEAKSSHNTHTTNVSGWLDHLNITGSVKRPKKKNRSSITPKLIRKQAEWRYASLSEPFLSSEDLFETSPESFEDKKAAEQAGLVLNNQFNNKIKKVAFVDEYVRTVVDEGTVIVKITWEFEQEEIEVEQPVMELQEILDPVQAQQMLDQGLEPVEEVQIGVELVTQTRTVKNQPAVEVCEYMNIILDPTAKGDIDKASFIIHSFESNLSELRKDGRYSNLNDINVSNSSVLSDADHTINDDGTFTFKDKPRQKFVAYEYWGFWDIDKTGIVKPIVATYVNDTMIRLEENPFPDKKLPFVAVSYLPVRKSLYGEPDGELLSDNQEIIGAVTRGMIDIMGRSANGQTGYRKDSLDVTNKRRFEKGENFEFNPSFDAKSLFHTYTYQQIPQSAEYMINHQNAEAESLTGVKAFHSGISGQALGDTATGIRSALDATSKRELGILRRLAQGIRDVGKKILAMNQEFLSEEEIIRVTNEEFIEIRRDALIGNYDIKLSISTAEVDNQKSQDLGFMMQTMGNNMDPGMSKLILSDIAKLKKMPTLAKMIEDYEPQPDPLEQERKMLEVELLKAQITNEQNKAMENAVDVELKTAKTDTEVQKARNLGSKSDNEDLKYLQDDSGISHAQDMQKKDHDRDTKLDEKVVDGMIAKNATKQANDNVSNSK